MKTARHLLGLFALAVGVWGGAYLWSLLGGGAEGGGVRFTLLFRSAEGLTPGATIKYRGVSVGEVRRIALERGGGSAQIECVISAAARGTVGTTTRFWIVRPRFRGIAQGASGLETLIKDSYITYSTPAGTLDPLPDDVRLRGLDAPLEPGAEGIGGREPGDLEFTVLFAESGGLERGSPVRFRGLPVGVVTSVSLDRAGGAVVVEARIPRPYRSVVTDATLFWVARPMVAARWLTGLDIRDIDALLGGTYLSFYPPPQGSASPARDGSRFVGALERPNFDWDDPELNPASSPPDLDNDPFATSLVTVHYSCVEKDWLSADDRHFVTSPGCLFRSADGNAVVLVARTGVDGAHFLRDGVGEPEIRSELRRVTLADGSVYGADLVWHATDADLALLALKGDAIPDPPPSRIRFDDPVPRTTVVDVVTIAPRGGEDRRRTQSRATLEEDGTLSGIDRRAERAIVLAEGFAIGIVGAPTEPAKPLHCVPFSLIPTPLRASSP